MTAKKSQQNHYTLSPWGSHLRRRVTFDPVLNEDGSTYTKTKLEFQDECDINTILNKYMKTGELGDPARQALAKYGDWSDFPKDYKESLDIAREAHDLFFQLPAKLRDKFNNDPNEYLDYATNPNNLESMVELGLATKRKQPEPPLEDKIATAVGKALEPKAPKPNKASE